MHLIIKPFIRHCGIFLPPYSLITVTSPCTTTKRDQIRGRKPDLCAIRRTGSWSDLGHNPGRPLFFAQTYFELFSSWMSWILNYFEPGGRKLRPSCLSFQSIELQLAFFRQRGLLWFCVDFRRYISWFINPSISIVDYWDPLTFESSPPPKIKSLRFEAIFDMIWINYAVILTKYSRRCRHGNLCAFSEFVEVCAIFSNTSIWISFDKLGTPDFQNVFVSFGRPLITTLGAYFVVQLPKTDGRLLLGKGPFYLEVWGWN